MAKLALKLADEHAIDTVYTGNSWKKRLLEELLKPVGKLAPARIGMGWGFSQAKYKPACHRY